MCVCACVESHAYEHTCVGVRVCMYKAATLFFYDHAIRRQVTSATHKDNLRTTRYTTHRSGGVCSLQDVYSVYVLACKGATRDEHTTKAQIKRDMNKV